MLKKSMRQIGRPEMDEIESMPIFMDELDLEFYPNTPAPSEDIWKKFELLPTPPRSPAHEPQTPGSDDSDDERLLAVTDFLDLDEPIPELADIFPCCSGNIKSKLIQDCMWSAPMPIGPGSETLKKTNSRSLLKKDNVASSADMINSSECVDPAAVFPYPLSDSNTGPTDTSSSAFDTPEVTSESEDDDDDDVDDEDDEDDEEIDVVTVADKIQIRRKPILPAASSMSAQVAAMHNYSNAQSHSHSSSYTHSAPQSPSHSVSTGQKRSRPISMPASPQPAAKRQRSMCQADLKRVVQKLHHHSSHRSHGRSYASRNSSDSEDSEGKRAQHNVLERKRRNDLKSSFHRLRDHIPEIRCQERAPKVVILKKAADYVKQIRIQSRSLDKELDSQKLLHEQLKRRLAELRREF